MDIDIYQQCPCHSGNKIKFCCGKDIVSELNQIVAKCNSNQSLSALDQIERVIAKQGEKDCLLTLKTHILFTMGEIEKATACNERFMSNNPTHPIGKQNESLTALAAGDVVVAIDKLQDAMDLVTGDEIPLTLSNAFKMVGAVLLQAGHLIAARAHVQFAIMIRGEASDELQHILRETFKMPGTPIVMKTDFRLDKEPEGKDWSSKYAMVVQAMNRGQFRLALKMLNRIDEHWPNQTQIVRGIAVVNSMLANEEAMADAWHHVSTLDDVPEWQAVEYESLSQLFLENEPSKMLDIVSCEFDVSDFEALQELAFGTKRLMQSDCPDENPFGDGPPPRHAYYVLDREQVEASDDLSAFDIPIVTGEFLLFGKQTDKNARLIFVATKANAFDDSLGYIKELFGDLLSGDGKEEIISSISESAHTLTWNWQVPKGTSVDQHRSLMGKFRNHVLLEKWSNIKFSCLDSLTPLEAAEKPELKNALGAMVLNLEPLGVVQMMTGDDVIVDLKAKLGISEPEQLNANDLDEETLTPLRMRFVDPKTFSDEQIRKIYFDSIGIANTVVLRQIVPEILSRESMHDNMPRDICYSMLAQLSDDNDEAIEHLRNARNEAVAAGRSIGLFLVQEFEIRLSRGMTEKLPELLQTIRKQYVSDPNVEFQLSRVLNSFGLITPDGQVSLPSAEPAEESASSSKIWTPDSGDDTIASGSGQSEPTSGSKIWVPGAD